MVGTPDHDDFIKVQNKINELIENNNKQSVNNFKKGFIDQDLPLKKTSLTIVDI